MTDTTIRTSPAVILAKLRKVNQQITRLATDHNHNLGTIKRLQAESNRLNSELRDAYLWRNARILDGKPVRAQ